MPSRVGDRLHAATRDLLVSGVAVGSVGLLAHAVSWVLLAGAVGPTAYVFAAHPRTETARLGNALVGHGAALVIGLASLRCFGLWHRTATVGQHPDSLHVISAATAVGVTVFVLDVLGRHHAPAAATALLVAGALIPTGRPVLELAAALVTVSVIGAAVAKVAIRSATGDADAGRM